MRRDELNLQKQTKKNVHKVLKDIMFFKKKLLRRVNKMANIKKENSKTLSEEVIDTLINCFHSYEFIWNVTSGDCKDQNRKSLPLEEFDMSGQQRDINTYDYKKIK